MKATRESNSREMTKLRLAKAVDAGLERGRKDVGLLKRISWQVRATPVTAIQIPGIVINRVVEMLIGIGTDVAMAHRTNLLRCMMNDDPATIYDFLEDLQLADPEVVERFFDTFGAGGLETLLERADEAKHDEKNEKNAKDVKNAFQNYHKPRASLGTVDVKNEKELDAKAKRAMALLARVSAKAKKAKKHGNGKPAASPSLEAAPVG